MSGDGLRGAYPTLTLPDPDERHVLAAAISANAPIIVTFNLSDFPARTLAALKIRAVHPDDFAVSLFSVEPEQFVQLVKLHRQALVNPPKEVDEYLATLSQCGLPKIVDSLQVHRTEI